MSKRIWYIVIVVGMLLLGGDTAAWAQPIKVIVDGQPLVTSAPPTEIGGRILVGMRDIFERLGASVQWNAAEQKITAMRGTRVVTLWIGRPYAMVDNGTLPLDVPPRLIGGFTYVPVRFPSEALGADVTWLSATRTVIISTANMPSIEDETLPPPPPPTERQVKGTLMQILQSVPRALTILSYDSGNAETYVTRADTVFRRGEASVTVLRVINADELLPGDDVTLILDEVRQITQVEARYKLTQITYQAAAVNSLLTETGNVFHLASDVKIRRIDAGEISLADLRAGEQLTLRL
ncbi:MAG: copper amine oxidase N-terminal domain-containing protein, partial [Candidatus Zipacnadales bacterium]